MVLGGFKFLGMLFLGCFGMFWKFFGGYFVMLFLSY